MSVSSTRTEYAEWITAYAARYPHARGRCVVACQEMRVVFPELKEVRGFVSLMDGTEGCEHAWLVDPLGNVVDPTTHQYPFPIAEYHPFQPGDTVRVGKCMECGEPIYAEVERLDDPSQHRSFCDDECRREFELSLGG
jgi:hypothetical protein